MACSDVNAIMIGYRGRIAMLKAIHGAPGENPTGEKRKPGANFRTMVKWHNAKLEGRKKRGAKS